MGVEKFKSECSSAKRYTKQMPPTACSSAPWVLVHVAVFWLVFLIIFLITIPSPKTCRVLFPCPFSFLFSPYFACTAIAFLYVYRTSVHELSTCSCLKQWRPFLLWNGISALSMVCSLQSAWNVFSVLHEVRNNSFDTRPPRLLTAQFCFTFWCCVTLYCSKNSI